MYGILFSGVLLIFLVCLYIVKTSRNHSGIYGIPRVPLFQVFHHVFRDGLKFDTMNILNGLHNNYGPTFYVQVKPFSPIVITSDHNYFGQILGSKDYLNKPANYDVIQMAFGDSLPFTEHIHIWKNDRKILNAAFGHDSFKVFLERLDQKLHDLELTILEKMGASMDMQDIFHKFVLHITIDSIKDPCVEWDPQQTNEFKESLMSYFDNVLKLGLPVALNLHIFYKKTARYYMMESQSKIMRQYGMDLVDAHLTAKHKQTDPNNIIFRMYEAGVPYSRIVDNVLLFITAAHDTVATALSFLFYELSKTADVQNKICTELETIIGKDKSGSISFADIQKMKYIECVVKEGLRLRPTIVYVMRTLHTPAIVNHASLPQGTNILFNLYGIHRSEKYYKNPLIFNPDRFNEENKSNMVAYSWAPFSLGIRNCIGMPLAIQEMKLILARLVRRFEFSPVVPEHVLDVKAAFTTKSANGVPLLVKLRHPHELPFPTNFNS